MNDNIKLNDKEIKFLKENIKDFEKINTVKLIEILEDYIQLEIDFDKETETLAIIENILDKLAKIE